jgi:hypothetical protein
VLSASIRVVQLVQFGPWKRGGFLDGSLSLSQKDFRHTLVLAGSLALVFGMLWILFAM